MKKSTLWAALSDILRLLILTRDPAADEAELPSQRFYLEGDNIYPDDLQQIIQGRGFVYHSEDSIVKSDSYFIDLAHPVGKWFKQGLRTHMVQFLTKTSCTQGNTVLRSPTPT